MTPGEQSGDVIFNLYVYDLLYIAVSQVTRSLRMPGLHHTNIISIKTVKICYNKTFSLTFNNNLRISKSVLFLRSFIQNV